MGYARQQQTQRLRRSALVEDFGCQGGKYFKVGKEVATEAATGQHALDCLLQNALWKPLHHQLYHLQLGAYMCTSHIMHANKPRASKASLQAWRSFQLHLGLQHGVVMPLQQSAGL